MSDYVNVIYISSQDGEFGTPIAVPSGTTAGAFFRQKHPDRDRDAYSVLVNRQEVDDSHVLTDGCRISIGPKKMQNS